MTDPVTRLQAALTERYRIERELGPARRGRWKYLRSEGRESLFDVPRDPGEGADLAAYERETLAALREEFRAWNQRMLPRPPAPAR